MNILNPILDFILNILYIFDQILDWKTNKDIRKKRDKIHKRAK